MLEVISGELDIDQFIGFRVIKEEIQEEKLNYKPLVKLLKKILPHGIPELPKIHQQIEKAMLSNGYISINNLLKIINRNRNISENIKKEMLGAGISFEITVKHILHAMKINDGKTWFSIANIDGQMMIRSNFEHTIEKVRPELVGEELFLEDFLKNPHCELFLCENKKKIKQFYCDYPVKHKTFKFWSSIHPPHYTPLPNERDEWIKVYFDVKRAFELGFRIFYIEERFYCMKDNCEMNGKIYFTIPKNLFRIDA